jgi:hypothetical protein
LLQGGETTLEGLSVDPNEANGDDFGAFVPFETPVHVPIGQGPIVLPPDTGTFPQIDLTRIQQNIALLIQIAETFARIAMSLSGQAAPASGATPPAPQLSPIDKALGGQALVGLKTPLAIAGFAGLWIVQSLGGLGPVSVPAGSPDKASTAAQVLYALVTALGGLGLTAKFDRATQAFGTISSLLQKPPKPDGTP